MTEVMKLINFTILLFNIKFFSKMMSIFFITLLSLTTSKIPINYIYKPLLSKDTRFTKAFLSFNSSNVLIETDRPNFIIPVAKITELKKFTPISEKRLEITNSSIKKPFFKFTDFLITTLIKTLADEHFCFEISKEQEENNLEDGFVICSENESIFSEIEKIKKDLKEQEPGQQLEIQSINGLKRDFMVDVGDNREEKVFIGKNGIETQDGRVLFNLADIDAITQVSIINIISLIILHFLKLFMIFFKKFFLLAIRKSLLFNIDCSRDRAKLMHKRNFM